MLVNSLLGYMSSARVITWLTELACIGKAKLTFVKSCKLEEFLKGMKGSWVAPLGFLE
jgi:hypothetical protein